MSQGGKRKNVNESHARDEHDIPLSVLQPCILQSLKVNDLLLDFIARLGGQLLCGRHTPPRFADTGKCWGCDELAQEVAARLASGAEDKRGFRSCGPDIIWFTMSCNFTMRPTGHRSSTLLALGLDYSVVSRFRFGQLRYVSLSRAALHPYHYHMTSAVLSGIRVTIYV